MSFDIQPQCIVLAKYLAYSFTEADLLNILFFFELFFFFFFFFGGKTLFSFVFFTLFFVGTNVG